MGISIKEFCQIQRNEYITVNITSHKSVRNNSNTSILTVVENIRKDLNKIIRTESKKYWKFKMLRKVIIEQQNKASYVIDIIKNNINFYMIFPAQYEDVFLEKIRRAYPTVNIMKMANKLDAINTKETYFIRYKYDDALSLNVDKRDNFPLNDMLNVVEVLKEGEQLRIIYNFRSLSNFEKNGFKLRCKDTFQKIKNNDNIVKDKSSMTYYKQMFLDCIEGLFKQIDSAIMSLAGAERTKSNNTNSMVDLIFTQLNNKFELSKATINKSSKTLLKTDIVVQSVSEDKYRARNNALCLTRAYGELDGNNELIPFKAKKQERNINPYDTDLDNKYNIMSSDECSQFVQLPGRELCNKYNIKHGELVEVSPNELLMSGYIRLGDIFYKGIQYPMYHRDSWDKGNLPLALIGEQGSGKTTYFVNYALDTRIKRDALILIDYISECESATAIENALKLLGEIPVVIDYSNIDMQQALDFNELNINTNNPDELYDIANTKAQLLETLIHSIIPDDPLSSSMSTYLSHAAQIVFLQPGTSLRDVYQCLNNHETREKYIESIPKVLLDELQEEIQGLRDLHEWTKVSAKDEKEGIKSEPCGTRTSRIEGINTRISQLKKDRTLKRMYSKDSKDNINLVELIKEGRVILFKMPEKTFITPISKNVLVTFLTLKIWTALKLIPKNERRRCHVIIDELFQAPTAMNSFKATKDGGLDILPQTRKFGGKFVFSCQDFTQLAPIWINLKAAGSSIMLLKGVGEGNYKALKPELEPEFQVEDIMSIPQYSALCIINTEEGKKKFIVKLPTPNKEYLKLVRK